MAATPEPLGNGESRLDQILGTYFAEVAAGHASNPRELLARHPEMAAELQRFFDDDDTFNRLLAPLRPERPATLAASLTTLGFELLEEIGRGGMGVVYKAKQRDLDRVVALKIIRTLPQANEEEGMYRFRAEAQAAARLQHDNIVRVYQYGRVGNENYYTMDLIAGKNLADLRDRYTRNVPAVVALMLQVTRAVDHAHGRGILHRDLKPSNILVDDETRTAHVADFGLAARLNSDGRLAEPSSEAVGTVRYMAPEQETEPASVTVTADVFSLGVILYELLAGEHPLRLPAGSPQELVLARLRVFEALPPRALNPKLTRDLESVCLKCLAYHSEKRYSSARELADDLARVEKGLPVSARPLWVGERAGRWIKRNIPFAIIAALVVMMAGTVVGFYLHNLYRERDRALEKSQQELDNRQRVSKILETFQAVVREERVGEVAELEKLKQDLPADPTLRLKIAQTWNAAGDLYRLRRQFDRALKAHGEAEKLFSQLVDEYPDQPEYRAEQAAALQNLGLTSAEAGDGREAEQRYLQAQELLESLLHEHPDYTVGISYLAHILGNRAVFYQTRHRYQEALDLYQRLATLLETVPGRQLKDTQRLATTKNNLAEVFEQRNMKDEAEKALDEALALRRQLVADEPENARLRFELATTLSNKGLWYRLYQKDKKGDEQAEKLYREAVNINRELSNQFRSIPEYLLGVIRDQYKLASTLDALDQRPEARATLERMVQDAALLLQSAPGNDGYHTVYLSAVGALIGCYKKYELLPHVNRFFDEMKADWRARAKEDPVLSTLPAEIDQLRNGTR